MSQARSTRGSSRVSLSKGGRSASRSSGSAASQSRGRGTRGPLSQPKNDIFVVLLGVSLGSMVLGCLFLALKLNAYGFSVSAP